MVGNLQITIIDGKFAVLVIRGGKSLPSIDKISALPRLKGWKLLLKH